MAAGREMAALLPTYLPTYLTASNPEICAIKEWLIPGRLVGSQLCSGRYYSAFVRVSLRSVCDLGTNYGRVRLYTGRGYWMQSSRSGREGDVC